MTSTLFHYTWTRRRWDEPAEVTLRSPLLALHLSSDVDPLRAEQIARARHVLRLRSEGTDPAVLHGAQREVLWHFLAGRNYFGADQTAAFADATQMAREGRDVFVVVKYMDEAPHIAATFHSLLNQQGVDLGRLVIVATDNNSTDGSDQIVRGISSAYRGPIRIICLNQDRPGAGHAARLGVDRCLATILRMCETDGDWSRLQNAVIAVSDGDTVYHPHVLRDLLATFASDRDVDGVMPFLIYKLTAGLRLFAHHRAADPRSLARLADSRAITRVPVELSTELAFARIPRDGRRLDGDTMTLRVAGADDITVPLCQRDAEGRRFGVLRDPSGHLAYLMEDRTLVLASAPDSGADAALVFTENGLVGLDERWRWHAVIGHDLFLLWLFEGMDVPVEMIYPDTSDALKAFRAWAFAIGGQHQLRRPGLRIVTGSDYQSGRVLQATGCVVRLAPASSSAQTETDRLVKMARNLVHGQAVFYGSTRGSMIERASGLYVHMTRIQTDVEAEVRAYDDQTFRDIVFPERILFPLRWMFQNALRFAAHDEPEARDIVRKRFLEVFYPHRADEVEWRWFSPEALSALGLAHHDDRPDLAERMAEEIIGETFPDIMACYRRTLLSYFTHQQLRPGSYEWLLEGIEAVRNAIRDRPANVTPATVWEGREFVIDVERGQAVRMSAQEDVRR